MENKNPEDDLEEMWLKKFIDDVVVQDVKIDLEDESENEKGGLVNELI